jgi:hypothetical protein
MFVQDGFSYLILTRHKLTVWFSQFLVAFFVKNNRSQYFGFFLAVWQDRDLPMLECGQGSSSSSMEPIKRGCI